MIASSGASFTEYLTATGANEADEIGQSASLTNEIIEEKVLLPRNDFTDKLRLMRKTVETTCSSVTYGIGLHD